MAQDSSAVLTYGSAVSFATKSELSPNPSFLSATGFSDVRVFVTRQLASGSVTGSFRNCAWLVVPAEAHSAAAFYNSLLNKQAVNQTPRTTMQRGPSRSFSHEDDRVDSSSLPDDVADELARAEESVQIERAQNAKQAKMREGMPVRYGQEIQLLHINSGKFVTARPQRLAESNAESLLCELDPDGTDDSHFTIMPRYKHRRLVVRAGLGLLLCLRLHRVEADAVCSVSQRGRQSAPHGPHLPVQPRPPHVFECRGPCIGLG